MNEKTMVADALTGVNGELKMFGDMSYDVTLDTRKTFARLAFSLNSFA